MRKVKGLYELGFQKAEARNIIGFIRKEPDGTLSMIKFNTEEKTVHIDVDTEDFIELTLAILEYEKELGWLPK